MMRLMLDYFRRWWWVLALAGLFELWVGSWIANRPQDPFEFWVLMGALWAGANLLSFDFNRPERHHVRTTDTRVVSE